MKIVLDMNISPRLTALLREDGCEVLHWSSIGNPRASDETIMTWAREHGYLVITHDLDFGAILATTKTNCPSVLQVRTPDVSPDHLLPILLLVLERYKTYFEVGALVSVDEGRSRVRILPFGR